MPAPSYIKNKENRIEYSRIIQNIQWTFEYGNGKEPAKLYSPELDITIKIGLYNKDKNKKKALSLFHNHLRFYFREKEGL